MQAPQPAPQQHAPHVGGSVVCRFCGMLTRVTEAATCAGCGGVIQLLEPFAVDCGWCDASNRRDLTDTCSRCGGPLPALPGGNPGPTPPASPRALPPGYVNRIMYRKNVRVILGMVFTIVFCWTVVFPLIGIPLWISGSRWAKRKLGALRDGQLTRGRITSIVLDTGQKINGKSPWKISYEFDTPQGVGRGSCEAWDPFNEKRSAGDVLWVAYLSTQPDEAAIWPPIH